MLGLTYYGARQYLNTLDGKVVHEGEIWSPLCSGVRRVRKGWNRDEAGRVGRRWGGWICTRGTSRFNKGMEQIGSHSFIRLPCIFFPVFDWQSIDHPPALLLSLLLYPDHLLPRRTWLQVRSITIPIFFFFFPFVCFENDPWIFGKLPKGIKEVLKNYKNQVSKLFFLFLILKLLAYFMSKGWNQYL